MEGEDIPRHFLCPISLQLMSEPVTVATGITYDRRSIERWLVDNSTCPVTVQPLSAASSLIPNHTLRRLIHSWCTAAGRDPAVQEPPADPAAVARLLRRLPAPHLRASTLGALEALVAAGEGNRACMRRSGVVPSLLDLVSIADRRTLEQCFRILSLLAPRASELRRLPLEALVSAMLDPQSSAAARTHAVALSRCFLQDPSSPDVPERQRQRLFLAVVEVMRARVSPRATREAVEALLAACRHAADRARAVAAGSVAELIEVELGVPERRTSELVMAVLEQLCSTAEGRAQLVGHAAGIAVVAKRILRVSPAADECAVGVLSAVCRSSGTAEVVREMLRVGGVAKLCMVLQAECSPATKERARKVLKLHSEVWSSSPCIQLYLLTRQQ